MNPVAPLASVLHVGRGRWSAGGAWARAKPSAFAASHSFSHPSAVFLAPITLSIVWLMPHPWPPQSRVVQVFTAILYKWWCCKSSVLWGLLCHCRHRLPWGGDISGATARSEPYCPSGQASVNWHIFLSSCETTAEHWNTWSSTWLIWPPSATWPTCTPETWPWCGLPISSGIVESSLIQSIMPGSKGSASTWAWRPIAWGKCNDREKQNNETEQWRRANSF